MYFALCGRLRQLFVFSALCLTALLNAQQTYEAGYLVTSDGGRQQVDILNLDWRYTPTKITVLRGGEPTVIAVSALNEFGIPGKAHFVNYTVQMERSSTETGALPSAPTPLRQERLLLRAEVAGPASLYSYSEQQVTKFFLQLDSTTPPTQLVYQRWVTATNKVRENKQYALQLMSALQCGTHSSKQTPGYELRELREIVMAYNACRGAQSKLYTNNAARGRRVFVGVTAGAYLTRFKMMETTNGRMLVEMESKLSPRIGLELEYRLPFGNNKYGLVIEPNYYRYQSAGTYSPVYRIEMAATDHAVLQLPLGLRYYSFMGSTTKIFATLSGGYNFVLSGNVHYDRGPATDLHGSFSASGGLGLRFREHFGVEVRYQRNTSYSRVITRATKTSGIRVIGSYVF